MAKEELLKIEDEAPLKEALDGESELEMEVEGDGELPDEALVYDEEAPNLVATLKQSKQGRKALKKISEQVIRDFDSAWESSEEYRERSKADWKLFTGDLPSKSFPFEHCSNAHIPVMLENISRVVTRAEGEIFGDWKNVFGVLPIHPEDEEVARILTMHGNWQLRHQITDFRRQMTRSLMMYFMNGDFTVSSYYDAAKQKNRHEVLSCDEFVIPYVFTTTEVDYSDVPFLVKIMRRYKHELQRMRGEWENVDDVIKNRLPSWDDEPEQDATMSASDSSGRIRPDDDHRAPYKLLEYCGWAELPNQTDERYIKAVVDHSSKQILLLQIYEEDDWQDRQRYERQKAELEQYRSMAGQYAGAMAQADQIEASMPDPVMDPEGFSAATEQHISVSNTPEPPPPPSWVENPDDPMAMPEPVKRVPIHMYTHGVCIEPMAGSLGMGYGRIQSDMNRAINVAFNQYIDAATLANVSSYVVAGNVQFEKPFSLTPGKINIAKNLSPQDLSNAFKELRASPANEQLVNLVRMLYDWAASSMQAPDVLSGESGKSGETYRGIATRLEQATKQLSVFTQRFAYPLENVLKNNARLNAKFLEDEEIIFINDTMGDGGEDVKVGRAMYERDYKVEIRSDMRFTALQEKVSQADELVAMPGAVPPLQGNIPFIYATVRKALEARERYDLIPFLGPPPTPPETTLGVPPPPPPMPPGMEGMEGMPPGVEGMPPGPTPGGPPEGMPQG